MSRKLFDLWTTPVKQNLQNLKEYLEKPLDPDWKIPLSHVEWENLLVTNVGFDHPCYDEDLKVLFKQCEDETADGILDHLKAAITRSPLDSGGTEDSLIGFWDDNIRMILIRCLNAKSVRYSSQCTETGQFRPNFGLLLDGVCVFRGEEKRKTKHPKREFKDKTRWVYEPAPYILGW